jgi:hypothetical protein
MCTPWLTSTCALRRARSPAGGSPAGVMAKKPRSKMAGAGRDPAVEAPGSASKGGGDRTGRSMKRRLPHRNAFRREWRASVDLVKPAARRGNLERDGTLPGVGVAACPEGDRVNRGGPPVRREPGRVSGSEPPYKVRAEVGGWAEGVGVGSSTVDPPDSTTGGREGPALRSCWRRGHG